MSIQVSFEDLPLIRFHIRTVFSGTGGQFSDGFVLGIIGIAVSMAAGPLQLNALWMGLLGAASLAGLFLGSMFAGPVADKYGRPDNLCLGHAPVRHYFRVPILCDRP